MLTMIAQHRYTNAAVNIVTDLATALLPLPVITKLDIPKRQKVILMCVFAAGILYVYSPPRLKV